MSRRASIESRLVGIRFPFYNEEVSKSIAEIMRRLSATYEITENVLDEIIRNHPFEVEGIVNLVSDDGADIGSLPQDFIKSCVFQYYDRAIDYESQISDLPIQEFIAHYKSVFEKHEIEKKLKNISEGEKRDLVDFFNEPCADINEDFWIESTGWSAAEAVALSLGKDPTVVNEGTLTPYKRPLHSPFRYEFERRLNLLNRAISVNELTLPLSRKDFADWATKRGWALEAKASKVINQSVTSKNHGKGTTIDEYIAEDVNEGHVAYTALKRKYNKLLLLCFGLTRLNYGYNPYDKNTVKYKEISEDIFKSSLFSISDETIKSRLHEAFERLPVATKRYLESMGDP